MTEAVSNTKIFGEKNLRAMIVPSWHKKGGRDTHGSGASGGLLLGQVDEGRGGP
jgi:hypothetical protein